MVIPKASTLPERVSVPPFRTKQQVAQQTFVLGISGKTLDSRNIAIGTPTITVNMWASRARGTIVSREVVVSLVFSTMVSLQIN